MTREAIPREWCAPDDIPRSVGRYGSRVDQLDVGTPGKVGAARLRLEVGPSGRTVVSEQFSQVPLQVQRAMYPGDGPSGMAHLYMMSVSGGILQGDRNRIDVEVGGGAAARILTQGSTRVYSMNADFATQIVNLSVGEGAYLEYVPHSLIPYRGSRYYQRTHARMSGGTLLCSEVALPGRMASGEAFAYDICYLRSMCSGRDGRVGFLENLKMEPGRAPGGPRAMKGMRVMGTVYAFFGGARDVEEDVIGDIGDAEGTYSGTTSLPNDAGMITRILGNDSISVLGGVSEALESYRRHLPGSPFRR